MADVCPDPASVARTVPAPAPTGAPRRADGQPEGTRHAAGGSPAASGARTPRPPWPPDAHVDDFFALDAEALRPHGPDPEQGSQAPRDALASLAEEEAAATAAVNAARHDWIAEAGRRDRTTGDTRYLRTADRAVSTTDPDATHLRQRDGVRLGYQAHYVVDGGKARIILAALVTPAEVPEDWPAADLL